MRASVPVCWLYSIETPNDVVHPVAYFSRSLIYTSGCTGRNPPGICIPLLVEIC
jgi:hypothetical protein